MRLYTRLALSIALATGFCAPVMASQPVLMGGPTAKHEGVTISYTAAAQEAKRRAAAEANAKAVAQLIEKDRLAHESPPPGYSARKEDLWRAAYAAAKPHRTRGTLDDLGLELIRANWTPPASADDRDWVELVITFDRLGKAVGVGMVESSGNQAFNLSIMEAARQIDFKLKSQSPPIRPITYKVSPRSLLNLGRLTPG